ncbi:Prephenate dehydratase [Atractiella rhizophila]|nr:Prephenate dehydratase [Atractiella rhizophila]
MTCVIAVAESSCAAISPTQDEQVYFLGPLGSYSHQAAVNTFPSSSLIPMPTFPAIFEALVQAPKGHVHGVIPIKNSYHGAVTQNIDLLEQHQHQIDVEKGPSLKVSHCLLRRKCGRATNPTMIASHEQALGQCKNYLQKHYAEVRRKETSSTSEAARIATSPGSGEVWAIASELCVDVFDGLELVDRDIQDAEDNITEFVILTPRDR